MRYQLLAAAVALLLAAGVASSASHDGQQLAAVEEAPVDALAKARQGLAAMQRLVSIFTHDLFKSTPVGQVAGLLMNALSFVSAFLSFFFGGGESAELRYMRQQFAIIHGKLDAIRLQLDDIMRLIDWRTVELAYSRYEQHIAVCSKLFDLYLQSSDSIKEMRRDDFVREFSKEENAALHLYMGVVDNKGVLRRNLATAAAEYSKNYKSKVMSFLLAVSRLVLRGAQMQIAFDRIQRSEASARQREADWRRRMQSLAARLQEVDRTVEGRWNDQMKRDVPEQIVTHRDQSRSQFANTLINLLTRKYPWRRWFVLVTRNGNDMNMESYSTPCGGVQHFNTHGGRNVLVASADPGSSRFNKREAENVLALVNREVYSQFAYMFTRRLNHHLGTDCQRTVLRAVVHKARQPQLRVSGNNNNFVARAEYPRIRNPMLDAFVLG